MRVNQFMSRIFRRKILHVGESESKEEGGAKLARHMGGWDLTALGIGSTLGAGIYVITGTVAHHKTGPAIVLSFAIAGFASILAGLSYAEFGSRVPRAGSAYVYSFVAVGELVAWITGWNLILEYIIGASSVARGWSSYFDALTGHFIEQKINSHMPEVMGQHTDIFAFIVTMVLTILVGLGVKESTRTNNILTAVNLIVVTFVVIAGLFYVDFSNWKPFAPYGPQGVFKGAATAFFAYIGFDVIATSAEETIKPEKNVPFGIVSSLSACALSYMAVSAVITMMVPYYEIPQDAPLSNAFKQNGADWAKIIIAIGALCGLSTSLMASIFPLPRIIYAIANDGLLWPWLGRVHTRFHTPLNATIISGLLAGLMAFIFNINELADMMSIGTLMSYSLVGACVVILRYEPPSREEIVAARLAKDSDPLLEDGIDVGYDTEKVNADDAGVLVETPKLNALQRNERGRLSEEGTSKYGTENDRKERTRSASLPGRGSSSPAKSSPPLPGDAATESKESVGPSYSNLSSYPGKNSRGPDDKSFLLPERETDCQREDYDQEHRANASGSLLNESKPQRVNKSCGWLASFLFTLQQQHHRADVFKAIVTIVFLYTGSCFIASFLAVYGEGTVSFAFIIAFAAFAFILLILAATVPREAQDHLTFKCPFVPVLPMLSMAINIYLLASLDKNTWIRFGAWTVVGFAIYFGYGIRNSTTPARKPSVSSEGGER